MKILYLAVSWPSKNSSSIGSPFFRNRINLIPPEIDFDVYSILPKESCFLKIMRRGFALNNKTPIYYKSELSCENFIWKFLYYKESFFAKLRHRKNISLIIDEIVNQVEQIPNILEYSLIQTQYATHLSFVACKLKQKYGIPYVIKAHGSDIHTFPLKCKQNLDLTLEALENANKVIFVSRKLLEVAKSFGYRTDNYEIIPNGIDPAIFMPMNKQAIKANLEFSKKVVGFVGRLIPVKRVDKFASIFSWIQKSCLDVQFLVVGSGFLRKKLEKTLKLQGIDAVFTGQVPHDKVPFYMNAMDVMILPSRNEGWPCVVLEAHACGVPVVGSSNGGIPEAVGNTDFIVEEDEHFENRFAEIVCEVLDDENIDTSKLIDRANKFTWQNIVDLEVAIYNEIELNRKNE